MNLQAALGKIGDLIPFYEVRDVLCSSVSIWGTPGTVASGVVVQTGSRAWNRDGAEISTAVEYLQRSWSRGSAFLVPELPGSSAPMSARLLECIGRSPWAAPDELAVLVVQFKNWISSEDAVHWRAYVDPTQAVEEAVQVYRQVASSLLDLSNPSDYRVAAFLTRLASEQPAIKPEEAVPAAPVLSSPPAAPQARRHVPLRPAPALVATTTTAPGATVPAALPMPAAATTTDVPQLVDKRVTETVIEKDITPVLETYGAALMRDPLWQIAGVSTARAAATYVEVMQAIWAVIGRVPWPIRESGLKDHETEVVYLMNDRCPYDRLNYHWGLFRSHAAVSGVEIPAWPVRKVPEKIESERDLAFCLYAVWGPAPKAYDGFTLYQRRHVVLDEPGSVTFSHNKGYHRFQGVPVARRAMEALLRWGSGEDVNSPDPTLLPHRPVVPVKAGGETAMMPRAVRSLCINYGFKMQPPAKG